MRAGASNHRVTTPSRSDRRSPALPFAPPASVLLLSSLSLLLLFQRFDDLVQLAEPLVPELVVVVDPRRHLVEPARADAAVTHPADLLRGDEPRVLEDADVLPHAGEGHVELLGEIRDRGLAATQLLQHAATGAVRQRSERGVEMSGRILNHMVQY